MICYKSKILQSCCLAVMMFCVTLCHAQQTKKAFFIGNSYTFWDDVPELVRKMALNLGDTLIYNDYTAGGYSLRDHMLFDQFGRQLLKTDQWDYVVLQEQSQKPALPINTVFSDYFLFSELWSDTIRANWSCSRPVFFRTWGWKNGDPINCPNWTYVCTYQGMDDLLQARISQAAMTNKGILSPVGVVWRYLRKNHPNLELYDPDQSHPSNAGSYAAACTFNTIFFQSDPSNLTYNYLVPNADAAIIRNAVKLIVYDSLSTYLLDEYLPKADYTYTTTLSTAYFTNSSLRATEYLWDFGDGIFSTDENPIHNYGTPGVYKVHLTAKKCSDIDTISSFVQILSTSTTILNSPKVEWLIHPNPAQTHINLPLHHNFKVARFYSHLGQWVQEFEIAEQGQLDISELSNGVYFVSLHNPKSNSQLIGRFLKRSE